MNLQTFLRLSSNIHSQSFESSYLKPRKPSKHVKRRIIHGSVRDFSTNPYTRYPESLQNLIEFLRSYVLYTALTAQASVSIKSLTRAYTTSKYNSAKNVVEFELETGIRTAISKTSFTKLLNLSTDPHLIDPDTVSSPDMIRTFNTMGHTPVLTRLSAFKKQTPITLELFIYDLVQMLG